MRVLLLWMLACVVETSWAKTIRKRYSPEKIDDYLLDFGYLAPSNLETGALRSKVELLDAIKNLQRMGGLEVTGDPFDPKLRELLKKNRCGVSDRQVDQNPYAPQSFQVSNHKWEKKVVTWKIKNFNLNMDSSEQRRKFMEAFALWHKSADISFQEVGKDEEADIVISFDRYEHGDGYPLDGKGGVLAHAFPPGPGRGGDAHFDLEETWSIRNAPSDGTDLYTVAAHEFGHSLGIYHSDKEGALMYPWYQGYKPNLQLEYDDILAIQTIYGGPPSNRKTNQPPKFTFSTYPSTQPPKVTQPPRIPTRPDGINPPDPCTTTIDDVALIRGETFAFKDKWYWRFDQRGQLMADKAHENKRFWIGLPEDQAINAASDLPDIDLTIFFIGTRFWLLRARHLLEGFPAYGKDLSFLGIQTGYIDKVDAAMMWGYNRRVYIFSGDIYWRLSNDSRHMTKDGTHLRVDKGYPKSFDLWEGIPVPIDGAYTNNKQETFFFSGTQYWAFDDKSMKAKEGYPKDISKMLNCMYAFRSSALLISPHNLLLGLCVGVAAFVVFKI